MAFQGKAQGQLSPQGSVPHPPSASTQGFVPSPTSWKLPRNEHYGFDGDQIKDEDMILPQSSYKSLDFILDSLNARAEGERLWIIGLQAGIGLGISGAREAVLNEMENESTVFGQRVRLNHANPDPHQLRMMLGEACRKGFDLRVAYRVANHFIAHCRQIVHTVVDNGYTSCLPGTGNHITGTAVFYSEEDIARCHENCRKFDEMVEQAGIDVPFATGNNPGAGLQAPIMGSFMGDGASIGGVDMTRLDGASALIANNIMDQSSGGTNSYGNPHGQSVTGGLGPISGAPHLTGSVHPSGYRTSHVKHHMVTHKRCPRRH
ncbi:hypothetical protein SAMD00023353_0204290 [Rosellinia necatrix]|uniref:Uncharacterized protein n=1 Tax=Rosellinia necatrix TaxID=77044 RepID=A0A1W2TP47_ROSNE|nr:hypothetical protein SAMD00023353_0204290 [Rosellinia necatrix]